MKTATEPDDDEMNDLGMEAHRVYVCMCICVVIKRGEKINQFNVCNVWHGKH